jgi:hypothetical protein
LDVDTASSEFEILNSVLSNETRLDDGERDDGWIESGVERKMQVALSSGPGQEQGDIHVLLLNVSVLDDLLVLLSNETRLDDGERDDGCVDEGGIESGVERKLQVALSSGPGQEQGDIHVLLSNVSELDDLLVLQLSFRSFNFENRIP